LDHQCTKTFATISALNVLAGTATTLRCQESEPCPR
jgi:hypothetical protein